MGDVSEKTKQPAAPARVVPAEVPLAHDLPEGIADHRPEHAQHLELAALADGSETVAQQAALAQSIDGTAPAAAAEKPSGTIAAADLEGDFRKGIVMSMVPSAVRHGFQLIGDPAILNKLKSLELPKQWGWSGTLALANLALLRGLKSYETFRSVYSTLETFSSGLSLALHVWDAIPPPGRTGILYLTGRAMHSLNAFGGNAEQFLVDADSDKPSTRLVKSANAIKLLLQNPIGAGYEAAKAVYSRLWGSTSAAPKQQAGAAEAEGSRQEAAAETQAPRPAGHQLFDVNLGLIRIKVDHVRLDKGDGDKKKGGLHARFGLDVRLLDEILPVASDGKISLVLPFEGGFILGMSEPVQIIKGIDLARPALDVGPLIMTELEVDNHGLNKLGLSLEGLSIGKFFHVGKIDSAFVHGAGALFKGKEARFNFPGEQVTADFTLALAPDGTFAKGSIDNFDTKSKFVSFKKAEIDDQGFTVEEVNFPSLGGPLLTGISAKIERLSISKAEISGEGEIGATDITLIDEVAAIDEIKGKVQYSDKAGLAFKVEVTPRVQADGVKVTGVFIVGYDGAAKETTFGLRDGALDARYDYFRIDASGIAYEHQNRTLSAATAALKVASGKPGNTLERPALEGDFTDLSYSPQGAAGKGTVRAADIVLFNGAFAATNIEGKGELAREHLTVNAGAALHVNTAGFEAGGKFDIGYDSETKFSVRLDQGTIKAHYGPVALDAKGISYQSAPQALRARSASVTVFDGKTNSLRTPALKGQFTDWTLNDEGITGKGEVTAKPISLFNGALTVKDIKGEIDREPGQTVLGASAVLAAGTGPVAATGAFKFGYDSKSDKFSAALENGKLNAGFGILHISASDVAYNSTSGKFTIAEADVTVGTGAARDKERVTGINFGMLDFLAPGITVKAKNISYSDKGLHIGFFRPSIPNIGFAAFGFDGYIAPRQMEAGLKGARSLKLQDVVPLPPLLGVSVMVFPGVSVGASIQPIAELDMALALSAKGKDGLWTFGGTGTLDGKLGIRAKLGVELGQSLIVALAASGYVEGMATANATAGASGQGTFDRDNKKFKSKENDIAITYAANAAVKVTAGVELSVKAFYFFEKTLYERKAKEWNIGRYQMSGTLLDKEGALARGRFKGEFEKNEAIDAQAKRGDEADNVLMSGIPVPGSQQVRADMLTKQRDELMSALTRAAKAIEEVHGRYAKLITKKDKLFRASGPAAIEGFNEKFALDKLVEQLEAYGKQMNELEKGLTAISMEHLELGVDDQRKTLDDTSRAGHEAEGEAARLSTRSGDLEARLDEALEARMARLRGVMVRDVFIAETSTGDERKKIVAVDNALENYHRAPSWESGAELMQAIDTYRTENKSSKRLNGVNRLASEVKRALSDVD